MKNLLSKCDFMGFSPNLFIHSEDSYKSPLTGLLSIIIAIVSILCTGYFGLELLQKKIPTVLVASDLYEDFGPLPMSNKGYLFLFAMEFKNYTYYSDPTIFQVTAYSEVATNYLNSTTGQVETKYSGKNLKMDLCSKFYTDDDIVEKNMKLPLEKFYCLEPGQFNVTGFWASKGPYSYVRINFDKCRNSTESNITCRPTEEIEELVQGGYISIKFSNTDVDQINFENPINRVLYDDYNLLNSGSSLEYAIQIQKLYFQSDNGLVLQDKKYYEGVNNDIKIFTKIAKTEKIFSAVFQGSPTGKTYKRSYTKFQNVMTEIGGFIKFVMIIGNFLSFTFSENLFFANYVYDKIKDTNSIVKPLNKIKNDLTFESNQANSNLSSPSKNISSIKKNNNTLTAIIKNSNRLFSPNCSETKSNKDRQVKNQKVFEISQKFNLKNRENRPSRLFDKVSRRSATYYICDFIYNVLCFCKSRGSKSINYKVISNMKCLYRNILSVDCIILKSYELEYMKKCWLMKNVDHKLLFNEALTDTLAYNISRVSNKKVTKNIEDEYNNLYII